MPRPTIVRHSLRRNDSGAAAVELALLLPLLALLLAGLSDLGLAMWHHQAAVKAARDAVRFLARTPTPWDEPAYEAQAINLARTGELTGTAALLAPEVAATFTYPVAAGAAAYSGSDRMVVGVVSFKYSPLTGFAVLPEVTLRATHVERYIGE